MTVLLDFLHLAPKLDFIEIGPLILNPSFAWDGRLQTLQLWPQISLNIVKIQTLPVLPVLDKMGFNPNTLLLSTQVKVNRLSHK